MIANLQFPIWIHFNVHTLITVIIIIDKGKESTLEIEIDKMIPSLSEKFCESTNFDVGCHIITHCYSRYSCTLRGKRKNLSDVKRVKLLSNPLPSIFPHIVVIMSLVLMLQLPSSKANAIEYSSISSYINSSSTTTITNTETLTTPPAIALRVEFGSLLNYLRKQKTISIPENRVITSEDTEDYLDEDLAELDYDELLKRENASGILYFHPFSMPTHTFEYLLFFVISGSLVGSSCEFTCDKRLHHVYCNPNTNRCECEKKYPVKLGQLIEENRGDKFEISTWEFVAVMMSFCYEINFWSLFDAPFNDADNTIRSSERLC